ncbi:6-O-methylguanine DNA methyltransferase [Sphaerosporella brunnea]|uniref:Methylated-DNA--protein-cysteine methyltransferase n=1 Tax=Sphaerosporella brunnea TaxID=1250544 RepID=A0A5J5EWP5_9PEZI|nr:6-O-methylguanine DNA methyltransferase [Sphaerosporella brunnea]
MATAIKVTPYQERVYKLLCQIPAGNVSTYKYLADALNSSPRAVGGALRRNPFAPEVPCHRIIATTGYIGGFMGDWEKAPSGINCDKKLELLKEEGVEFDEHGMLKDRKRVWNEFVV